nr:glycosyltransferase [Lichenifustis flavocetrariae]
MTGPSLRICLVASELLGAHKNGGIGTATTHLALFLARSGHRVTVLYTGAAAIDYMDVWPKRCISAGVSLIHLDARRGEMHPVLLRETCVIFEHLRTRDDDLVLFQDWEGPAFSSIVAKRTGLAFAQTVLGIFAHGPTAWLLGANQMLVRDQRTLAQLHTEGEAFSGADVVVSPSRYMLDWLRTSGQVLPPNSTALPLYLWSDPEDIAQVDPSGLSSVNTLAFFGRLETRKGVDLFLEAILSEQLTGSDFDVVFLGKPASHTPDMIRGIVGQRRPDLLPRISFETDLDTDGAQRFLRESGALAVIPSLTDNAPCVISECLRKGIPFLSTLSGGIPELISAVDVERVLVEPRPASLAKRLASLLGQPFAPAQAAYHEPEVARSWLSWLDGLPRPRRTPVSDAKAERRHEDRIAVIVTHYERPVLLNQALEALAAQTYTDFDLILVDDGSPSLEAERGLAAAENRLWPFRLKVMRETNRYLGAARNAGLRSTDAERLIFMDDDNLAFPDLVETLDRAMTMSQADIVTCQMALFRNPLHPADPAELLTTDRWGFLGGPLELGLSINCFGDATGIYRREVFEGIGPFHEEHGVGFEDWHLHARAALAGFKTVSLPVPLFWYRRLPTGMSVSTNLFANTAKIWRAYADQLPPGLQRLVDLSVRNALTGDLA